MNGDDEQELIKLSFPQDLCVCFSGFPVSHTPSLPSSLVNSSPFLCLDLHFAILFACLPSSIISSPLVCGQSLCLRPHLSVHPSNYPIFPFNIIVPYSHVTVVEMDVSYFAKILQVSGCPWHINKLPTDEEKCKVLLSHFPEALECNFTLIMLL